MRYLGPSTGKQIMWRYDLLCYAAATVAACLVAALLQNDLALPAAGIVFWVVFFACGGRLNRKAPG
jgi:hypothetical protein